ncbi:MAG: carboxymuconolactone decarboxylase family protein [Sedimentisphaerales bacterium]|nr:carboxymuconolactone decarboxylase family protein [Sedimentisphaerales bacterium]
MMSEEVKAFFEKWKTDQGKIAKAVPDATKAFGALHGAVIKDGALSVKHKELIAMALGMALRCEPCLNLHIKKCLEVGATREEILDATAVVVMMQGGPGYTHVPSVLDALEACGA